MIAHGVQIFAEHNSRLHMMMAGFRGQPETLDTMAGFRGLADFGGMIAAAETSDTMAGFRGRPAGLGGMIAGCKQRCWIGFWQCVINGVKDGVVQGGGMQ